jgi:hypothetical protein
MHLGLRLLFGFVLITGLAAVFVLRVFVTEVKPSVREVMEDLMVDSANLLAEQAAPDLRACRRRQPEGRRFASRRAPLPRSGRSTRRSGACTSARWTCACLRHRCQRPRGL